MVNNRCAHKQPGTPATHWGDVVEFNKSTKDGDSAKKKSDYDKGTFEGAELLFGGVLVTNQEDG